MKNEWLLYVILAGLAWGTYVPLISYGGSEFSKPPDTGSRLMAILCVGIAYFVLAVAIPMGLFLSKQVAWPDIRTTGLVFSGLAGIAGAVGALCVIFATTSAVTQAKAEHLENLHTYRLYIAPIIFGLAPVINTLVSSFWHPEPGNAMHFRFELPGWKVWLGILLVGAGAALVLFSKEESELKKKSASNKPPAIAAAPTEQKP